MMITASGLVLGCTSHHEPELPSSTDTAAIAERVTGSDGPIFLRDIASTEWQDDGRRAGDLFAWIPQNAQSSDRQTATRAGESAHAIASFIADEKDALDGAPANSALWQSFARSLTPYLGAMVGDERGIAGFPPLDGLDSAMRRTAAVFAMMHRDPEAIRLFTEAATERAHTFETGFAETAAAEPTLTRSGDALEDLMRAARLRGLLAAGAHIADPESPVATPMHAQTEVMYQVASRSARPGNPHISPEFFRDGRLLSPEEIPESNWSIYDSQLTVYLAPFRQISDAIRQFGQRFVVVADQ
ncbi:hypothetical protein H7J88_14380 [Mycolicibacterium flavescens]|nr:hypothetical protein [Mycolicibacterium flavescens]MCV7280833.1 hypothetical protein [Mycolicibacterium flavescens]